MHPQVIPANWRQNMHFTMEAQAFAIGEIVVVRRSNGSFCFAKIEKFAPKTGSYDVSLDTGDAKNPASSMKTGLPPKLIGKIAQDANRIVIMPCLDCKENLTEQAAVVLNNGQAIAFRLRVREVLPLHLALHFLERNKWCLNFCHRTGLETPMLIQALNTIANQNAAASHNATAFATSEQVTASQRLNLALNRAKDSSAGTLIDLPQVPYPSLRVPPPIKPRLIPPRPHHPPSKQTTTLAARILAAHDQRTAAARSHTPPTRPPSPIRRTPPPRSCFWLCAKIPR
jgi:hypothetical protein